MRTTDAVRVHTRARACRRAPGPTGARGFTLLEAIVAMVIFSMGAFALYAWLSANVITLQRIGERREAAEAVHSALGLVRRVNPMEDPTGFREVGDMVVRWNAKPVEAPRQGRNQTGLPTAFEIGLYDLDVGVFSSGREIERFRVRQVGYRQTQALEYE